MKHKPKYKLRTDPKESKSLILRLKKIEGQIRGIQGMIENKKYCDDVLNQISSVKSALDGVSGALLKSHIRTCVTERIRGNDSKILEEFIRTVGYVLR
ncbi:metal-sensitive transcriptional regulator [Leptospira noguchii]|uniref:Metal-sensitive transcriptional repressor n=3 Tax=Leptospira noguchii TaxID=28182 RepID=M6U3W0_9LEPT|nr:metal-sensitive transcriptional regulator [Leptospira noguchii]EKR73577.1 metal-sensitive transcriptional repressor [Leptospira noguchii str. 2006001870]EMI66457.1 metal-sensitive transcriptional repressor [Leptospira noguchii str. Bonito]EMN02909.1 metal-sensitive transcriptional repressor [Leptospira noguchii str. 2007001578]EMO39727.1 metal-sensitive transcriptional repressor [Leptospira noguchii serovar Autumnalis str. ZUN142]EMS84731.1 metal-sensitive transcriptional repressor [Leptosp